MSHNPNFKPIEFDRFRNEAGGDGFEYTSNDIFVNIQETELNTKKTANKPSFADLML